LRSEDAEANESIGRDRSLLREPARFDIVVTVLVATDLAFSHRRLRHT
jgi:hypothetical protein